MPTTQNVQNVQNVQNIQNVQHIQQPGQAAQPMPTQTTTQMPQNGGQMSQYYTQGSQQSTQMQQDGLRMTPFGAQEAQNDSAGSQYGVQMSQSGAQTAENSFQTRPGPITDWSSEITPPAGSASAGQEESRPMMTPIMRSELAGSTGVLDLRNHVSNDVIEAPTTVTEAYLGSMRGMLARNKGNFVVATFLIGTQGTTTWEGILYEVGNDYLIIQQSGRERYIACDMYSLKYIEFYDTQRKEICDNLMWQNGWQDGC